MNFLLYMSTPAQIVTVTIMFSGLSVLGLYLVRVLVPVETLKKNHEVAGSTFGVLGAFYGLLLAFVIVAAWERFDRATENVQKEGVALISLYRLSKGLSAPTADEMRHAIRAYTHRLIDVEWPEMANRKFHSIDDSAGTLPLWQIVATSKAEGQSQSLLLDKSFDQLSKLSEASSLRYLYAREDLPSVVWLVIYAGLLITIGFTYFFGLEAFWPQALMCAVFSTLLGLTILAILELAHPYQGSLVVSSRPLQYALSRMDDIDSVAVGGVNRNWQSPDMNTSTRP